jgi:serine O-acetyltransferase
MTNLFNSFKNDIRSVFERDPAARTPLEVVLTYSGLHALWGYRLAHWLWTHNFKLLGRVVSQLMRGLTGIEIHPGAIIGQGFFIDHGMGVVIGETAEVGRNVTLYHGVTLGGVSLEKGKRHPTLGDNVVVGAGAKILGAITIGDCSRIGANAVVVKNVPANSVVVGVPGQVVMRSQPSSDEQPDLHHDRLPDTIGASLASVMSRLEAVENKLDMHVFDHVPVTSASNGSGGVNGNGRGANESSPDRDGSYQPAPHAPDHGLWRGEDFMI